MPTVRNGTLEIHYREWGPTEGPALVLVHGLLFSAEMFDRLASHLPDQRVIAVDVRGHGASSRPRHGHEYSWELLASDVIAVIDGLGLDRVVVGGLSLGANVALQFAHSYPERVSALVVEMPVLSQSEGFARVVFGALSSTLRVASPLLGRPTALLRSLPRPPGPAELAMIRDLLSPEPLAAAALIEGLQASPLPQHDPATLAGIDVPVLVIGHHFDPIHHHRDSVALAAAVRKGELVSVRSIADHRLRPDRYGWAIGSFLARNQLVGLERRPSGA